MDKKFTVRILASDGTTFIRNLAPDLLKSPIGFPSRINGGLGELVLDLNVPFDNFDEGNSIDFMNIVDVYAVDEDHPRGRRIYRGFISRYEPYVEDQEGVRVTCLGLASLATFLHYKNGSSFAVTHTTQDPQDIGKAIIDYLNTAYPLFSYAGSTETVGTNVSVTFTDQLCFDALKKTYELAGEGWWWKIDKDGVYHLKSRPLTPTHTFTIGRDIDSLVLPKICETIRNEIQVRRNGGTATDYSDATSVSTYGRRTQIITDSGLTNLGSADQRGSKALEDGKDAKLKASITVNNEYDLESIEVGHTVRVLNVRKDNAFFGSNTMMIVGLSYTPDQVRIDLEEANNDLGLVLDDFVNG